MRVFFAGRAFKFTLILLVLKNFFGRSSIRLSLSSSVKAINSIFFPLPISIASSDSGFFVRGRTGLDSLCQRESGTLAWDIVHFNIPSTTSCTEPSLAPLSLLILPLTLGSVCHFFWWCVADLTMVFCLVFVS